MILALDRTVSISSLVSLFVRIYRRSFKGIMMLPSGSSMTGSFLPNVLYSVISEDFNGS